ncbi:Hypothetical protein MAU_1720 [Metamycoplasma auris 15026]|uniref:Uncharacterized protein n=1 Tax=Metamycoplasma auris 15026 TaxID=1188233 RepID=N9VCK6_9BACT|nr:hypothetical protein [Metamycoplasma auris]ENY69131.1 Hypothetical protein MAU_1720 [Metamycoplasma auris 15026]
MKNNINISIDDLLEEYTEENAKKYVDLVISISNNAIKIAKSPIYAQKFSNNIYKVLEPQTLTIPELQKLLELTNIVLKFDNSVYMEHFNYFECGADYLNFLIEECDLETVGGLKGILEEHDDNLTWIDWELYALFKKRNKKLPWLVDSTSDDDLVYPSGTNPYEWYLVDESEYMSSYLENHFNEGHILSWIKEKSL